MAEKKEKKTAKDVLKEWMHGSVEDPQDRIYMAMAGAVGLTLLIRLEAVEKEMLTKTKEEKEQAKNEDDPFGIVGRVKGIVTSVIPQWGAVIDKVEKDENGNVITKGRSFIQSLIIPDLSKD
ncbi:MAG: hypothetical protein U9R75_12445, partial [Candidatus Thermoplasmatota archaeon]|nr:hypothetical protein [Candidatus Thermoplasmatota archaeon]